MIQSPNLFFKKEIGINHEKIIKTIIIPVLVFLPFIIPTILYNGPLCH